MPESNDFDVVVVGATPGGIAAGVRAARGGHDTAILWINDRIGGMMAGGLSSTDSHLGTQRRMPILNEFFDRVRTHYLEEYGRDSSQFEHCHDGFLFEPHVAESTFEALVEDAGVSLLRGYHPTSVDRSERTINSVQFSPFDDGADQSLPGQVFLDATYQGDLAAVAGVPYRVGRESRSEFGEQYAGRLFSEKGTRLYPGSTGAGDDAVQAYNYRLCLTRDPENRRLPDEPPDYDRTTYLPMMEGVDEEVPPAHRSQLISCELKSELVRPSVEDIRERGLLSYLLCTGPLPNDKRDLNTADLPGAVDDYPEADWERRDEIAETHRNHVLGMLYFLQNDEAVPDDIQETARNWGLPNDEFEDNDNFPFQLYVREARRIEGGATFTEHNARLAEGIQRAPVVDDAIAVTDYPLDSHDCRPVRRPGSLCDGHFFVPEVTAYGQVPYGALLPESVDNLLVPVPLSASHVGYGTIRLEPTWMQIGESAGLAAARAVGNDVTPRDIDRHALQRAIVESRGMVTYFDDVDASAEEPWVPAVQYLGTKGFFASYEARPEEPLGEATAEAWTAYAADMTVDEGTPMARSRSLPSDRGDPVSVGDFVARLEATLDQSGADATTVRRAASDLGLADRSDEHITRGSACSLVYSVLS